jgi:selenocysteine lyase/cysteine desulfurase
VNITGQIFPVRDIVRLGREHGIPLVVDGAHAFAHWPFKRDELECDYYGTSLHKWLCAPHGTGFLYVRKERIADLWPMMAAPEPRGESIRKFEEIGTHPAANRLAIAEAITLHQGIGPERKAARLRTLRDRWADRLLQDRRVRLYAKRDPAHSCGVATVAIEGVDAGKLSGHLFARHRIITTAIDHPQIKGVRVTPNVYSTIEEVDMFSEAMEDVLANGVSA